MSTRGKYISIISLLKKVHIFANIVWFWCTLADQGCQTGFLSSPDPGGEICINFCRFIISWSLYEQTVSIHCNGSPIFWKRYLTVQLMSWATYCPKNFKPTTWLAGWIPWNQTLPGHKAMVPAYSCR